MLLTCGYKRTTVEEIARRAEIGKGTVYLHWSTKDELVNALLMQDATAVFAEIIATVRADARACMLHHVVHKLFTAAARYPLFRAMYAGDKEVMGRVAGRLPGGNRRYHVTSLEPFRNYLQLLMEHGCLRAGLDLDNVSDGLDALVAGFFLLEEESNRPWRTDLVPGRAYALAAMVRGSLEAPGIPPQHILGQIAQEMDACFSNFGNVDHSCRGSQLGSH